MKAIKSTLTTERSVDFSLSAIIIAGISDIARYIDNETTATLEAAQAAVGATRRVYGFATCLKNDWGISHWLRRKSWRPALYRGAA